MTAAARTMMADSQAIASSLVVEDIVKVSEKSKLGPSKLHHAYMHRIPVPPAPTRPKPPPLSPPRPLPHKPN